MNRRSDDAVLADPVFERVVRYPEYRSTGQRQCVRTLVDADPGTTVIASLPTGGGKTEVAFVEALRRSGPSVSLMIVPTVVLAFDLERRMQQLMERRGDHAAAAMPYAYTGDTPSHEREFIRSRIRAGEQKLLFTSPEATMSSLAWALDDAAASGHLRLFIVDEAHLIAAWGGEFRPEFQALAGLRDSLCATAVAHGHQPCKSLLLSATYTDASLRVLARLFVHQEHRVEYVLAPLLRAEPGYWSARCASEEDRKRRFLDLIANLPRPVVVYVAKVVDASQWCSVLEGAGYSAVATVTGDSSSQSRRAITRLLAGPWSDGAPVDIVVATSAFGLGVDQPDIRAIVHLCVPESLDRFYQEVGRAGRDGRPSTSVVLWTDADIDVARSLATEKVITVDRGLERWTAMIRAAKDEGKGFYTVSFTSRPIDLVWDSAQSRAWSGRTLNLMVQARLIDVTNTQPRRPSSAHEETIVSDVRLNDNPSGYRAEVTVRLIRGDAGVLTTWQQVVEPVRQDLIDAGMRALSEMQQVLQVGTPVCTSLQRYYTVTPANRGAVVPVIACGGCPGCGHSSPLCGKTPEPRPGMATSTLSRELRDRFGGSSLLVIQRESVAEPRSRDRDLRAVLAALVRNGVRLIVASPDDLRRLSVRELDRYALAPVFVQEIAASAVRLPHVPLVVLDGPGAGAWVRYACAEGGARPPRVLITTGDRPDPYEPQYALVERRRPLYRLATLIDSL